MGQLISLKRNTQLLGVLLLAIGFFYFSLTYKDVFYAPDEGATVYHFERCAEGAVQHRDFYSVYGFGFYAVGKALFQIFGCNLMILRVAALLLKLCILLLIYFLSLHLVRPVFAFFSSIGFIIWWGDPLIATPTFFYPIQLNMVLGLLGIVFVVAFLKRPRRRYIILSSLCVGMGSLFKPNIALFNLLAIYFFFFSREMTLNLTAAPSQHVQVALVQRLLPKIWIVLHLIISVTGIAVLFSLFAAFGLDKVVFAFFFIPIMFMLTYVLVLGIRSLCNQDGGMYWRHCVQTFWIFLAYGMGLLFWQLVQVAYFSRMGALQDFYHMLKSAGSYYSHYAIPLWKGGTILAISFTLFSLFLLNEFAFRLSQGSGRTFRKAACVLAAALSVFLFLFWISRLSTPRNYHIMAWYSSLLFSLYASYFIFFRNSIFNRSEFNLLSVLTHSLILFFTTTIFLDAFPKVDIGHITMVVPPFMILLGIVGNRFYDLWHQYLSPVFKERAALFAGGLTTVFGILLFLPSLLMMFIFHVPIKASRYEGIQFYQGKLQLVPRYQVTMERAKGISLHAADEYIGAPLEHPKTKDFFRVAERLREITVKEDELFSTMTSCLMLYFLSDRDGMDGKVNCYVFQTGMGVTTSEGVGEFSDLHLTRMVDEKRPKVIIVEENDPETERFIANWPYTWNFIMLNYKLSEQIGPYQIYMSK